MFRIQIGLKFVYRFFSNQLKRIEMEQIRCRQVEEFHLKTQAWLQMVLEASSSPLSALPSPIAVSQVISRPPILKLFCSDLNSNLSPKFSWKGAALTKLLELGYQNSYSVYNWDSVQSKFLDFISFSSGGEKALYDHIFFSPTPGILTRVLFCEELMKLSNSKEIGPEVDCPSDHLPLFVTFLAEIAEQK
eukprot:TRINITY_DN2325_c0_g1_i1.p1 TRINITY_DN2325_c0_g1~~TRINITY_DN2325_c0_g1_i1.p1  ORF type:complete len:190 (+),score=26.39 TRINITY_DN2325_c0_g1_i1:330-899(+)